MNFINLESLKVDARADLGTATFTLTFTNPSAAAFVNLQLYVNRVYTLPNGSSISDWPMAIAQDSNGTLGVRLNPNQTTTVTFDVKTFGEGVYDCARIVLFDVASNFTKPVYEGYATNIGLRITTNDIRVTAPRLEVHTDDAVISGSEGDKIHLPFTVKWNDAYQGVDGFQVLALEAAGEFCQCFVATENAHTSLGVDAYHYQEGYFNLPKSASGTYNIEFGMLIDGIWRQFLTWISPGYAFDVDSMPWRVQCPPSKLPERIQVVKGKWQKVSDASEFDFYPADSAVKFVRGGNFGGAIYMCDSPDHSTPGFFSRLAQLGLRWIRLNYNPDRYLDSEAYRESVDQVVQHIWMARLYPVLAPLDVPTSQAGLNKGKLALNRLVALSEIVAQRYVDKPVWIQVCNEPSLLSTWDACKPVMAQCVRAIRSVDANAFVIVPVEGFSSGSTSDLAADPITSDRVDLYDYHALHSPADFVADITPALQMGLPIFIGEYASQEPEAMHEIDLALQTLSLSFSNLMAAGPRAFTTQDTMPLITSVLDDIVFNEPGKQVISDFAVWDTGASIAFAPEKRPDLEKTWSAQQLVDFITRHMPSDEAIRAVVVDAITARNAYIRSKMLKALEQLPENASAHTMIQAVIQAIS